MFVVTKTNVTCPHCGKRNYELIFDEKSNALDKVKGAKWHPLLKNVSETKWTEHRKNGIGIECKCGHVFFVYDIQEPTGSPIVLDYTQEGHVLTWFCKDCRMAFLDSKMVCASCGYRY